MLLAELVEKLQDDLGNEYKHMLFYLQSSIIVQGLHRAELSELFTEHAKEEMGHVQEFSKMILDFGSKPHVMYAACSIPYLTGPHEILEYACRMELEVVENYVQRCADADKVGGSEGIYARVFLEDQILHSRADAAEFKQMVWGKVDANGK